MTQGSIALSADYADALIAARRAKNLIFWILLLLLLGQLALFFTARYSTVLVPAAEGATVSQAQKWFGLLRYAVSLSGLVALGSTLVLNVVLLLIVAIMLIGRLIGVARLVSAFLWSVVLGVCLFPWQAFLNAGAISAESFRFVGALFTWGEMLRDARFGIDAPIDGPATFLKWFRFVGFPLAGLIILLLAQRRSSRGLKLALGEAELHANDADGPTTT